MKAQVSWTGLWQGMLGRWTHAETRRVQQAEQALRQQIEAAKREVEAAEHYFQNVTDPELVDHAIYAAEAAKRKYLYLHRQLRRARGGTVDLGQGESEWM